MKPDKKFDTLFDIIKKKNISKAEEGSRYCCPHLRLYFPLYITYSLNLKIDFLILRLKLQAYRQKSHSVFSSEHWMKDENENTSLKILDCNTSLVYFFNILNVANHRIVCSKEHVGILNWFSNSAFTYKFNDWGISVTILVGQGFFCTRPQGVECTRMIKFNYGKTEHPLLSLSWWQSTSTILRILDRIYALFYLSMKIELTNLEITPSRNTFWLVQAPVLFYDSTNNLLTKNE